jgi:hypothetical protein
MKGKAQTLLLALSYFSFGAISFLYTDGLTWGFFTTSNSVKQTLLFSAILSLSWSLKPLYHLAIINTTPKFKFLTLVGSFLVAGISSGVTIIPAVSSSSLGLLGCYFVALALISIAQIEVINLLTRNSELPQSFINSFSYVDSSNS